MSVKSHYDPGNNTPHYSMLNDTYLYEEVKTVSWSHAFISMLKCTL